MEEAGIREAQRQTIGARIRRERNQRCWSQGELAERAGTTYVNVSRWERGVTVPGPHFQQRLCALFESSADDLGFTRQHAPSGARDARAMVAERMTPLASGSRFRRPLLSTRYGLIGRDELMRHIKASLESTAAGIPLVALYGLPGAGKTALASALAQDSSVLARFVGGVFWAGLGLSPNMLD
ncbi:MAG: helix-turn-helix domain-containing protein, partial [Ktedonobacterales bacterium]